MSGKCGPTLVADAAPDNWTFLGKPDEQAVDFFHAHLGEVAEHAVAADWYDRVTLRDARRRQGGRYAISATKRRRKRRPQFLNARFFRRHRRRLREPQGQGLRASSANKVLVNQRMKRARWSVDGGQNVLTFRAMSGRFDAAWQAMTGRRERQPECRRSLTAEVYKQNQDVKTGFLQI